MVPPARRVEGDRRATYPRATTYEAAHTETRLGPPEHGISDQKVLGEPCGRRRAQGGGARSRQRREGRQVCRPVGCEVRGCPGEEGREEDAREAGPGQEDHGQE